MSGLDEAAGAAHPTTGGLRIGKRLAERGPAERFDERMEWDRDGQYFHYLTKWMHALAQMARATREGRFDVWARELAATAHRAFSSGAGPGRRLIWKMSCDLQRPLVPSMGQHDALDGYVTAVELQATAAAPGSTSGPRLTVAIADFAAMMTGRELATADALGLGGLLMDAARVEQLVAQDAFPDPDLADELLASALGGLPHFARQGEVLQVAARRLAFRELGLAIGLRATAVMGSPLAGPRRAGRTALLEALERYAPLADAIEGFWIDPAHRRTTLWEEHRDINDVMLATCLAPAAFLDLGSAHPARPTAE